MRESARSTNSSPWPQDAFETSDFGKVDPFSGSGEAVDPFGGDYDPFKDQGFKDTEFSWEDEPDPFNTSTADVNSVSKPLDTADPFGFSINEDEANANVFTENADTVNNNKFSFDFGNDQFDSNQKNRSKSVIGDPFVSQTRETIPVRSKTSLGEPRGMDFDFDPFSSSKVTQAEKNKWKSNEDILSKIGHDAEGNATSSPFHDSFTSQPVKKAMQTQQHACLVSEDEQLAWAAQESIRMEEYRKQQEEQERAELELALTLSRSFAHSPAHPTHSSRSPSTGL